MKNNFEKRKLKIIPKNYFYSAALKMEDTTNVSYEFNSDITSNSSQVIALSCCSSKDTKEKGDLYDLFQRKFPYADVYTLMEKDAIPGSIKAFGKKSEGQKIILAIFAQIHFGEPSLKKDTKEARLEWMDKCLSKLFSIKGLTSIAFPYKIGCGLNEEDMGQHRDIVLNYAKGYPDIEVVFVSDEDDPSSSSDEDESTKDEEDSTKEEDSIKEDVQEESDTETEDSVKETPQPTYKIPAPSTKEEEIPEEFYKWFWEEVQNLPYINPAYFLKMYRNKLLTQPPLKKVQDTILPLSPKNYSWESSTLLQYTIHNIPRTYEDFFNSFLENEGMNSISSFLEKEAKLYSIQPELPDIYNAFRLCPMDRLKVIILGQDPYPTKGMAVGVAFGTPGRVQPSLRNIYTLLEKDGYKANYTSGDLSKWCKQGVFLLNTSLTVREGEAGSHLSKKENGPWENFTKQLLRYLDEKIGKMVVILWGNHAKEYKKHFSDHHFIIESSHPASSCYGGNSNFFESMCFSKTNRKLRVWKMEEIDWNLD